MITGANTGLGAEAAKDFARWENGVEERWRNESEDWETGEVLEDWSEDWETGEVLEDCDPVRSRMTDSCFASGEGRLWCWPAGASRGPGK